MPAAVEVQALQQLAAIVRGRQTRSALQAARVEVEAASRLQAALRGSAGRKEARKKMLSRAIRKAVRARNLRKATDEHVSSM